MSAEGAIRLVPYGEDPLESLVDALFDRYAADLPDLSRGVVLFPFPGSAPRFRKRLLARALASGHSALLPPVASTLGTWAQQFCNIPQRPIRDTARELLLFETLREFPRLTGQFGAWPLIGSLVELFEELTLQRARLSDNFTAFQNTIAAGYGLDQGSSPLSGDEVRLVHALWIGWREHLAERNIVDSASLTVRALEESLENLPPHLHIFVVGFSVLTRAERDWIRVMRNRQQLTLIVHGRAGALGYHPDAPLTQLFAALQIDPPTATASRGYTAFLDAAFAGPTPVMQKRAADLAARVPIDTVRDRLAIHQAADLDQEARAIDVQVRRWYLGGLKNIGIVTADRRLARRVRALLERAGINVRDAGGWALSTTSAATALMRWIECLSQDFYYQPLLDLLKSPFVRLQGSDAAGSAVAALEQHVIFKRNIGAGLGNYRNALASRDRAEQQDVDDENLRRAAHLLERLDRAARPIYRLMDGRAHAARAYLAALLTSLEQLGMIEGFTADEAGEQLLAVLDDLHAGAAEYAIDLSWTEFVQWLRRDLERRHFRPALAGAGVELMGISESCLYRFEAVIVAGCTRVHLPGVYRALPFFNDSVRRALGLPGIEQRHAEILHDFRRLLEAGARVLITMRRDDGGEPVVASPWVERLRAFACMAFDHDLSDPTLTVLSQARETRLASDDAPLPRPRTYPIVDLPPQLIPQRISASAVQRLFDCPYQFYAMHCLRLSEHDDISEELEKSDYGQRVHRILQAFHQGAPKLPGPWNRALTCKNRPDAERLLREITRAAFDPDLARDFSARGWLHRWEKIIPAYLDWELARAGTWRHAASELVLEREIRGGSHAVVLTGRIDRMVRGASGCGIIDFKTGAIPHIDTIARGEHVQLPLYALLVKEPVDQALFLSLLPGGIVDRHGLAGAELTDLVTAVRARLADLVDALYHGAGLAAWGDIETCGRCPMEGLCRKSFWLGTENTGKQKGGHEAA